MDYTQKLQAQQTVQNMLQNLKESSHAIILSSPDDVTMLSLAKLVVMTEVCESNQAPCTNCKNCKKILDGNAVDVQYFGLDKPMLVEDSTNIVNDSFVLPLEFAKKYFIIKDIDRATLQSQNKLLKVIEEPQHSTKFIFLTCNIGAVLPTIKSRCEIFSLPKLKDSELIDVYYSFGEDTKKTQTLTSFASGNLSMLIQIASDKHFLELYDLAFQVVINLKNSAQILQFSSKISEFKGDLSKFLEILVSFYDDILHLQNNNFAIKNKSLQNELLLVSSQMSKLVVIKIIEHIQLSIQNLKFNVNTNGTIDNLLLKILEIKYICK